MPRTSPPRRVCHHGGRGNPAAMTFPDHGSAMRCAFQCRSRRGLPRPYNNACANHCAFPRRRRLWAPAPHKTGREAPRLRALIRECHRNSGDAPNHQVISHWLCHGGPCPPLNPHHPRTPQTPARPCPSSLHPLNHGLQLLQARHWNAAASPHSNIAPLGIQADDRNTSLQ